MVDFGEITKNIEESEKEITLIDFLNYLKKNKLTVLTKEVKSQKISGVIYVPSKFKNKKVILILENE